MSALVLAAFACSSSDDAPSPGGTSGPPADDSTPDGAGSDASPASVDAAADALSASVSIPKKDAQGQPTDIALLIVGHSTSAQGDYPTKLANGLNAGVADGRNYVVFRTITGGDGGFLWTKPSFAPNDPGYARVLASQPTQYCEDKSGTRWSCRRRKIEVGLRGTDPAPAECQASQQCSPQPVTNCVWHEGGQRHEQQNMPFSQCWAKMDVRLALVQDTTNRSWPVDDANGDGKLDDTDYVRSAGVPAEAAACAAGAGTIGGFVDFNCDGKLDAADSARRLYASWLEGLATDLLTGFGAGNVHYVFFSHKPIEAGANQCLSAYPGETCSFHGARTSTASRPFDRFYLPSVYWEHGALELMLAKPGLDARIRRTSTDVLEMWKRSATCYTNGVASLSIPGAPAAPVAADDTETDGQGGTAEVVGCHRADHVHHNDSGGWLMADVWYRGLNSFLDP